MSELRFKSPTELQIELGRRLRQLRLHRNIDQRTLAEKAGIALTALQKLEAGRGSSVRTLVRTLKALNYFEFQHLMSVNGKFKDITRADLLAEADRFGVRRPNDLLAEVRAAVENWPSHARKAGLGDRTAS